MLFKDQGLIHEITTSVSYVDNILWVATYFGDSRYDGRYWHNFLTKDSGLPSNFTNFVKGVDANRAWFGTDKGLAYYDGTNWAVYTTVAHRRQAGDDGARRTGQCNAGRRDHRAGPQLHSRHRLSGQRHLGGHRQGLEPRNSSTAVKTRSIIMNAFAEILETIAHAPDQKARHDQSRRIERGVCLCQAEFVFARHENRSERR